ncbi:ABC transporter substrate-binding protein [Paenibacillus apiarius]|uniref:ABC transporter substrate-binding protein n=1 Tax=Paenibacillus apiarius TaxID=46240 RepID=A0ABT4DVZ3_9BACL|nr:ABC transporter substrate-binding protein [Paenibacillus apiarius]MCY9513120.1 ABC transporter substrate-binding protein [Paenibacillus apiarius]MCY9521522.1 ABC transporter substrate-binding protein [Paenibacillus apiarius]MCY9551676.1 ABC transporter substrate-binding protein [Paenibacillus apiarius]MCY9560536.1 ABC transporter substrate-binding protein [Paenibacillus apiarius]MCY9685214.1 ABC transporter substrate-binding protein [Paenibacillus apiarius]
MGRSRRMMAIWMAALLMMMMGLTGCGAQGEPAGQAAQQENKGKVQQSAGKPSAGTKASDQHSTDTRIVKDAFGEVEVPVNPQRVAALYLEDYVVALGHKPVVQWYTHTWGTQEYLKLDVPLFDMDGSIEAMLEVNPDLIILPGDPDAAKYEKYSKIAPTYWLPGDVNQNMRKTLETIGDLLGAPEKAKEVLAQYEQKAEEAKATLQKAVGEETVAVIRQSGKDKSLALFSANKGFIGPTLYTDLGLAPHKLAADMTDYHAKLSLEIIPELDADHIFIFPSNGDWTTDYNVEAINELESNPLWKNLPAVKNGHVYKVERSHWQTTAVTAKMMQIDDVVKMLVK